MSDESRMRSESVSAEGERGIRTQTMEEVDLREQLKQLTAMVAGLVKETSGRSTGGALRSGREGELERPGAASVDFGAGTTTLSGMAGLESGHPVGGAEATRGSALGDYAPGMIGGSGIGVPGYSTHTSPVPLEFGYPGRNGMGNFDSRILDPRHIRFDSSKDSTWFMFKNEIEVYARLNGFGHAFFRDPPLCMNPLNVGE